MAIVIKEARVLHNVEGGKTHLLLPLKKYEKLLGHLEYMLNLLAITESEHETDIPREERNHKFMEKRLN